jgi:hypothetical protein
MRLYKEVEVECLSSTYGYKDYQTYKLISGRWIKCLLPKELVSVNGCEVEKDDSQDITMTTTYYIGS